MNNSQNQLNTNNTKSSININEILHYYLAYWRWFVAAVIIAIILAFTYLRYSTPVYKSSTVVMLKDDYRGGGASELASFSDINIFGGTKDNVENEAEVLKSRTLAKKTIEKLKLNISYFTIGRIKSFELYKKSPIELRVDSLSDNYYKYFSIIVSLKGNNKFDLYHNDINLGTFDFGKQITNDIGTFTITNKSTIDESVKDIEIKYYDSSLLAEQYKSSIIVSQLGKFTSILDLSLSSENNAKAVDYLNTLVEIYNAQGISEKRYVSENTLEFLNNRLEVLTKELNEVETEAEMFKRDNHVTDIISEANLFIQNASEFEKKYIDVSTQISLIDNVVKGFINEDTKGKTFPILDALTSDPVLSSAINEHNKLVLHRNSLAENAGPENKVIVDYDKQIESYKGIIRENLSQLRSSLQISKADISKQRNVIGGRISSIPSLEKQYKGIGRQQGVKEALYLYLLQKREETEISMVAFAPQAKVIDSAELSFIPVSPKRNIVLLGAVILGLLIPFGILYVRTLFDNKVRNKKDLEDVVSAPFIGDVPRSLSHGEIIKSDSRSSSAEALRIVRTNMEFVLSQISNSFRAKTIFVTSTLPKEGKTFIAVNLAGTFALSGKKTLLIGLDIRNPKLSEYLNIPSKGFTNYLVSEDTNIDSYIVKQDGYKEFYILPPGVIPPNPAELLLSSKVKDTFDYLKTQFDYIIVDTAPVSLVTDTLLVADNSDAFIYVVRENYLNRGLLHIPEAMYKNKKLPNMSVLLNDTYSKKGYGYGYGYGYGQEIIKEPWYKRIFSRK